MKQRLQTNAYRSSFPKDTLNLRKHHSSYPAKDLGLLPTVVSQLVNSCFCFHCINFGEESLHLFKQNPLKQLSHNALAAVPAGLLQNRNNTLVMLKFCLSHQACFSSRCNLTVGSHLTAQFLQRSDTFDRMNTPHCDMQQVSVSDCLKAAQFHTCTVETLRVHRRFCMSSLGT